MNYLQMRLNGDTDPHAKNDELRADIQNHSGEDLGKVSKDIKYILKSSNKGEIH